MSTVVGQTRRNSNRTGSRNSKNMNDLMNEIPGLKRTSFMYQYCHARSCRQIEAVIVSGTNVTFNGNDKLQGLLARKGIAVMIVSHTVEDVKQEHPIFLSTTGTGGSPHRMSWDDFSNLLLDLHKVHVDDSKYSSCKNFSDKHLGYARDSANDEDLSISNVLRDVPGVRHLDVDGLILCTKCGNPRMLMEMTSDGFINNVYKSTYMSEKLAYLLGTEFALVQHGIGSIDRLIVTENVPSGESYTKTKTEMNRVDFKDWLSKPHGCRGK